MIEKWIINRNKSGSKNYIHFDINKKFKNLQEEIYFFEDFFSKNNISKFIFKPFIRYEIREKKFTLFNNEVPDKNYYYTNINQNNSLFWIKEKIRPITYASHRDSDIYSFYSYQLGLKYEKFLEQKNLDKNILAYRKVIKGYSDYGKNNIDFALDVFKNIHEISDCIVLACDISGFFDTLDHKILKKELINVLGLDTLPDDWYKIYKNLTKFSYVDKKDIEDYDLVKSLDDNKEFPKIIDSNKFNLLKKQFKKDNKKLIKTNPQYPENNPKNCNKKDIGIPQGTPISGMLANLYMSEFDINIKKFSESLGGKYYRYSDDILLIIPSKNKTKYLERVNFVSDFILQNIQTKLKLNINNSKTEICVFENSSLLHNVVYSTIMKKFVFTKEGILRPFQYLGFTFDGKRILIRNQTLSKYYKKLTQAFKRLGHLNDKIKDDKGNYTGDNYIKGEKILLGKFNRKYLFNGKIIGKPYIKNKGIYKPDTNGSKGFYLGFLSYGYNASDIFTEFCAKNKINNGIKKQLSKHRKKYFDLLDEHGIR